MGRTCGQVWSKTYVETPHSSSWAYALPCTLFTRSTIHGWRAVWFHRGQGSAEWEPGVNASDLCGLQNGHGAIRNHAFRQQPFFKEFLSGF